MRVRGYLALVTFAAVATAAACTLNPQPLPPGDDERNAGDDVPGIGFGGADAGASSETQSPPSPDDAAAADGGKTDGDGSADGSLDGGNDAATDGGDAGGDADAGS
jgi:hypothetical protein